MREPPAMQEIGPDRSRQPGRSLDPRIAVLCGMTGIVVAAIVLGIAHC